MIVTSKRCFINVLAQFMNATELLESNYYIADVRNNPSMFQYGQQLHYNEQGQLVSDIQPNMSMPGISRYNIKYGNGELDPSPNMTTLLATHEINESDPKESFVRHLSQTETLANVYNFLWGDPPKGNGLKILIIYDEDTVREFGYIICGYIAKNFGEDVSFIDAQYRPQLVKGTSFYKGDKQYAAKTIHDLQDYLLLMNFNQVITQMGYDESVNNLTIWLNTFNPQSLMHLYELLFPNNPLPSGNYTTDHIKQIIIGRVTDGLPKNPFASQFGNLYMSSAYLDALEDELRECDL